VLLGDADARIDNVEPQPRGGLAQRLSCMAQTLPLIRSPQ
jgi:hypothetical protein